jgi:hypothetical protein
LKGSTLKSVLEKAGVAFGESMRGKRLTNCLLVEAADGYRAVIAFPELDPAFTDKQTLLAFSRDGKPLGEKEGPYRIVIPDEKKNGPMGEAGYNAEDSGCSVRRINPSESSPLWL